MERICSLPMSVSRQRALDTFRPAGPVGLLRTIRSGPLRSIAEIYIPFRLYRVTIENASRQEERLLALDAVCGILDPFTFQAIPSPRDLAELSTRNYLEPKLDIDSARAIVSERVRRIVFGTGFFKIRDLKITAAHVPLDFFVPYWVGFSGWGRSASLIAMDAIRGSLEGSKLRGLITDWLAAENRRQQNNN